MKKVYKKAIIWGGVGTVFISLLFYVLQYIGMRDWLGPFYFLVRKWYFVIPLVLGFGIQIGLLYLIKEKHKNAGKTAIVVSGTSSSGAMIACCLHNFVVFLPFLGLTGIAGFFSVYQDYVFMASLLIVFFAIMYMLRIYKNLHACCVEANELV